MKWRDFESESTSGLHCMCAWIMVFACVCVLIHAYYIMCAWIRVCCIHVHVRVCIVYAWVYACVRVCMWCVYVRVYIRMSSCIELRVTAIQTRSWDPDPIRIRARCGPDTLAIWGPAHEMIRKFVPVRIVKTRCPFESKTASFHVNVYFIKYFSIIWLVVNACFRRDIIVFIY